MSFTTTTPQRPVPGSFLATPAVTRYQTSIARPTESQETAPRPSTAAPELSAVERAAKTINDAFVHQRERFPEIESYLPKGTSSEYVVGGNAAPFQKVKQFEIPSKILEQYNRAQMMTSMGLFADLNHAWVSIDNALYLWDYTHPDPELVGFEDQPNSITAVRMVKPRKGVFIPAVTRIIVIATTVEVLLIGVSIENLPNGPKILLYRTNMSTPIRGLDITNIAGDENSGRIFFSGSDNDIYELYYQQEERWFWNRCWKINHTTSRLAAFKPTLSTFAFSNKVAPETSTQLVVDSSRSFLYALSSTSTIRVFYTKASSTLELIITYPFSTLLNEVAHLTDQRDLLTRDTTLVSIQSVPATACQKLCLVATTSTGCRLYLSATSSYSYSSEQLPTSMALHNIRFPPPDIKTSSQNQTSIAAVVPPTTGSNSRVLTPTHRADYYPPGYFLNYVVTDTQNQTDTVFITAPDSGQLARMSEQAQGYKFTENGMWMALEGRVEDVGLVTPAFSASDSPKGFGNELAVQHDQPTSEIAILTNFGIVTLRRLRLVDEFAATVRFGKAEDGLEGAVKNFIRLYGRGETAASALAVACGQGLDVTNDYRVASITDPDVLEAARTAFIEYGGRPQLNENALLDQSTPAIDLVKPSPRHDGLALYISRLVRSLWNSTVTKEETTPDKGLTIKSPISAEKLLDVQQDLTKLREFLDKNRPFIDGLAGPEALGRAGSKQDEIALQAEHRAFHALVTLITNVIEGISFVQMLFSERIEELVLSLPSEIREQTKTLTYQRLFCTVGGRNLAKDIVKAIVNRNIQAGHNVDTVADSLRRRCGSFCSASDVIIFKAQEQLKRASEKGRRTELGTNLLNESLKLFTSMVESLTIPQLQEAVAQYVSMHFYAGAILLALQVAREKDRGNQALVWIEAGRPEQDPAASIFAERKRCYALIHEVIQAMDVVQIPSAEGDGGGRDRQMEEKVKTEAEQEINNSDDEVFQINLYDWYLLNGQTDKLLNVKSPYLARYLQRKAKDDITIADLLWRYHTKNDHLYDAAKVQLDLARSEFSLNLDRRIEYLSRAKANASTYSAGPGRTSRQRLLREIMECLEVANIQSDILQKLKSDDRLTGERRVSVLAEVDGRLLGLNELYNQYADNASYYDICLLIYQAAGHRTPTDIKSTWQNYLSRMHDQAIEDPQKGRPYEVVANAVRTLGSRLNLSEITFPVHELFPMLKRYAFEYQRGVGPDTWVVDLFLDLSVPHETIFNILQTMLYNDEAPFHGNNRQWIANDILYLSQRWFRETLSGRPFGSDNNANEVLLTLQTAINNGLSRNLVASCQELRARINQLLR